jgi:hypothetical protein
MKVEFYGHVRQYRNLQKQIDANLQQVLLSGQYVMGPMLNGSRRNWRITTE